MFEQSDVLELCELLTTHGILYWLDGGWAVDAFLGKQTRQHADVDIVIQQMDVPSSGSCWNPKDTVMFTGLIPASGTLSWR